MSPCGWSASISSTASERGGRRFRTGRVACAWSACWKDFRRPWTNPGAPASRGSAAEPGQVRARLRISPERYFVVAAVALVALTVIVFTGAAVRVTGSGLGCPNWPQCYKNGRLVAELNSHAWIEFGNRMFTGFVALAAIAAGLLAFFRVPFRRDLAILGVLLPLGVVGQAVMGGLTVLYGLAPGWVMGHYQI